LPTTHPEPSPPAATSGAGYNCANPWRDLVPADRAGIYIVHLFDVTPDARWYAYSYVRDLSDLYLVECLR
jgi:hypothetical protein